MKRWQVFFIFLLGILPHSALAVDNYLFNPQYVTCTAGNYFTVDVWARIGTGIDPSYNGTATLTSTSGAGTIFPASIHFTNGVAEDIGVTINATGSFDLTLTDSVATTITTWAGWAHVNPGPLSAFLIILPNQTYTPGVAPGVSPAVPTLQDGTPYPVTVYAVDQNYNIIDTYANTISGTNLSGTITPASYFTNDGCAYFEVLFSPLLSGNCTVKMNDPGAVILGERSAYIVVSSEAFLHLDVPSSPVTAGVPFAITATASYSDSEKTPVASSANGMEFQLKAYIAVSTTEAGGGLTGPSDNPFKLGSGPCPDAIFWGLYTYDRAEAIELNTTKYSVGGLDVIGIKSAPITVLPNAPALLSAVMTPQAIQSQHMARISATVRDSFSNLTRSSLYPEYVVTFEQISGNGSLSVTQTAIDDNGNAFSDFTGGNYNEEAIVRVKVLNTATQEVKAQQDLAVKISVAQPVPGSVVNYPNPFNPAANQTTSINYYLESASDVELRIYDAFGRLVLARNFKQGDSDTISRNATSAGGALWLWDGRSGEGRVVANGIYLVKITARGTGVQEFKRRVGVLK